MRRRSSSSPATRGSGPASRSPRRRTPLGNTRKERTEKDHEPRQLPDQLGHPSRIVCTRAKKLLRRSSSDAISWDLVSQFPPRGCHRLDREACLERIVETLLDLEALAAEGPTRLLLEATAGQGRPSAIASSTSPTSSKAPQKNPHRCVHRHMPIFVSGYDIRTKEGWKTLDNFDAKVGLNHLYAFHVNDSIKPLGSQGSTCRRLGKGEIGMDAFRSMMEHPTLRELPKYLETPRGPPIWKKEIALLREFAE